VVNEVTISNMSGFYGDGDVIAGSTPGTVDILRRRLSDQRLDLILDCPVDGSAVPASTITLTQSIANTSEQYLRKGNWLRRLADGTLAFTWASSSLLDYYVYRYTGPVEYGSSNDVGRSLMLSEAYTNGVAAGLFLDSGEALLYVWRDGTEDYLRFQSGKNSAEFGPGPLISAGSDSFDGAPEIVLPELGAASSSSTNIASFTREPDETSYYEDNWWYVDNTAWWAFTPAKTGNYIFHTEWSVPYDEIWWNDTELAIFSGANLTSLWWEDSSSDEGIGYSSYIYWGVPLTAGTTYHISVGCYVDDFNMAGYRIDVVLSVAWDDRGESFT